MSFSQLQQDLGVLRFYFKKRTGFFIEIGANDGLHMSNTLLLDNNGWKGICVEPNPSKFAELVVNRPKAICNNSAVFSSNGYTEFDIAFSDLLSGISTTIDKYTEYINGNKTTITVKTILLTDLLSQCNAPTFIEYLSLDTEGSEYEILRVFDFSKYIFGYIDVEHNFIEPKRTLIRNLLVSNGYIHHRTNRWDDIYVHSSVRGNKSYIGPWSKNFI